ncbi:MAG: XisH family protein [Pyrinomonadaceae bacterium]|nr:XisH family protein [Pyrinomonadaceae bacterium]
MARLDKIHDAVKNALVKDGWIITDDPFTLEYEEQILFVDLAGEKMLVAERGNSKIAVEIKSFIQPSHIQDLKTALGQYNIYETYLELTEPERKLYLAVGEKIYNDFFTQKSIQVVIEKFQVSLIIVDLEKEEIVKWTK